MATIIGNLRVLLGLNSTQYASGLRKASAETQAFTRRTSRVTTALIGNWRRFATTVSLVGVAFRGLRSFKNEFSILAEHGQLKSAADAVDRLSDAWRNFAQTTLRNAEPFITSTLNAMAKLMELVEQPSRLTAPGGFFPGGPTMDASGMDELRARIDQVTRDRDAAQRILDMAETPTVRMRETIDRLDNELGYLQSELRRSEVSESLRGIDKRLRGPSERPLDKIEKERSVKPVEPPEFRGLEEIPEGARPGLQGESTNRKLDELVRIARQFYTDRLRGADGGLSIV